MAGAVGLSPTRALLLIVASANGFEVLWNSPWPSYCKDQSVVAPYPDFEKFGVIANTNASFNGDNVWTIYCPTWFSTFPHMKQQEGGSFVPVNGGIPQRGNLSAHLAQVAADMDTLFPDADADGYIVIDWEVWVPWMKITDTWGSTGLYVNESLKYVRELHPDWSQAQLDAEAVRTWNVSALEFMVETLKTAQAMRPKAKVGYYGRPGCYTGLNATSDPPACVASVQERNDAVAALWAAGRALFPSVYIGPNPTYPFVRTPAYVAAEIGETLRVRAKFGLQRLPVIAFTWYDLFNTTNVSNWHQMTNATDLETEFGTPAKAGADGIIVWGGGVDASPSARCSSMAGYFESTLGPKLQAAAGE